MDVSSNVDNPLLVRNAMINITINAEDSVKLNNIFFITRSPLRIKKVKIISKKEIIRIIEIIETSFCSAPNVDSKLNMTRKTRNKKI